MAARAGGGEERRRQGGPEGAVGEVRGGREGEERWGGEERRGNDRCYCRRGRGLIFLMLFTVV